MHPGFSVSCRPSIDPFSRIIRRQEPRHFQAFLLQTAVEYLDIGAVDPHRIPPVENRFGFVISLARFPPDKLRGPASKVNDESPKPPKLEYVTVLRSGKRMATSGTALRGGKTGRPRAGPSFNPSRGCERGA